MENCCPYRCDQVMTRIFQSTYINRYLRFGDLDYTWTRAVSWIAQDIFEMIEPLTEAMSELYEVVFGENGGQLDRVKSAFFALRPLMENFRTIIQHYFFYAAMFKAALTLLKRWGFNSVDGLILKVNERINTLLYTSCGSFFIESVYSAFESDQYRVILDLITVLLIIQFGFSKVLKSGLFLIVLATLVIPQILMVLRAQPQE